MPARKLKEFLDRNGARYLTVTHSPAFTAQEIAAAAHLPGHQLAKSVLLKLDGKKALAVLPASMRVDFDLLREATGAARVELADEFEVLETFLGCEVGAMPPFGSLYGVPTYVADALEDEEMIAFNAGNFTELFKMSFEAFKRLEKPTVLHLAARV